MTDLIKRDDALALCDRYPYVEGVKSALEDLPAIDPAAIREAAMLDAGYDTTLTDRIEELVNGIDGLGNAFAEMAVKREAAEAKLSALEADYDLLKEQKAKAVEALREIQADGPSHGAIKYTLRAVLAELEEK